MSVKRQRSCVLWNLPDSHMIPVSNDFLIAYQYHSRISVCLVCQWNLGVKFSHFRYKYLSEIKAIFEYAQLCQSGAQRGLIRREQKCWVTFVWGVCSVRLPSQGLRPRRNFKTTLLIDTSQQQGKLSIDLLDLFANKVTLHLQRS